MKFVTCLTKEIWVLSEIRWCNTIEPYYNRTKVIGRYTADYSPTFRGSKLMNKMLCRAMLNTTASVEPLTAVVSMVKKELTRIYHSES